MSLNYPIPRIACGCLATRPDADATHVAACDGGELILYPISAIADVNNYTIDSGSLSSLDLLGCSALPSTVSADAIIVCDNEVRSLLGFGENQSIKSDGASAISLYNVGLQVYPDNNTLQTQIWDFDLEAYTAFNFQKEALSGFTANEVSGVHYFSNPPDGLSYVLANALLSVSAEIGMLDFNLTIGGSTPFGPVHVDARRPNDMPEIENIMRTVKIAANTEFITWELAASATEVSVSDGNEWLNDGGLPILFGYNVSIIPLFFYTSV